MITIREALRLGTQRLSQARQQRGSPPENSSLDAQILLGFVLGQRRSYLYTYPDQEMDAQQETCWQELLARRAQGEPVAYLVGEKAFFGLDFVVDRRVLIPRPETELLVEIALETCRQRLKNGQAPLVADIGTGSGAIAISLAVSAPRLTYLYATDISQEALAVASINCVRHHVADRVRLLQGDLLTPLPEPVDLLLANLPYVGTSEKPEMLPDVLVYEPSLALFSGPDGLDLLKNLLRDAARGQKLRPDATVLLEIGYQQREPVMRQAQELWPCAAVSCLKDFAGWDRIIKIEIHS